MNTEIKRRVTRMSVEDDHGNRADLAIDPSGIVSIAIEAIVIPSKLIFVPTKGSASSSILAISDAVGGMTPHWEKRNAWIEAIRDGVRTLDPNRVAERRPHYPCLDVPEDGEFL